MTEAQHRWVAEHLFYGGLWVIAILGVAAPAFCWGMHYAVVGLGYNDSTLDLWFVTLVCPWGSLFAARGALWVREHLPEFQVGKPWPTSQE